jgi:hypothetical protein
MPVREEGDPVVLRLVAIVAEHSFHATAEPPSLAADDTEASMV